MVAGDWHTSAISITDLGQILVAVADLHKMINANSRQQRLCLFANSQLEHTKTLFAQIAKKSITFRHLSDGCLLPSI